MVKSDLFVGVLHLARRSRAKVLEISAEGMLLESRRDIIPGQLLELHLRLDSRPVGIEARLLDIQNPPSSHADASPLLKVTFTRFLEGKEIFHAWLENQEGNGASPGSSSSSRVLEGVVRKDPALQDNPTGIPLSWGKRAPNEFLGTLVQISFRGGYVASEVFPPQGSRVFFEYDMPYDGMRQTVQGEAEVVRVNTPQLRVDPNRPLGMALSFVRVSLSRFVLVNATEDYLEDIVAGRAERLPPPREVPQFIYPAVEPVAVVSSDPTPRRSPGAGQSDAQEPKDDDPLGQIQELLHGLPNLDPDEIEILTAPPAPPVQPTPEPEEPYLEELEAPPQKKDPRELTLAELAFFKKPEPVDPDKKGSKTGRVPVLPGVRTKLPPTSTEPEPAEQESRSFRRVIILLIIVMVVLAELVLLVYFMRS